MRFFDTLAEKAVRSELKALSHGRLTLIDRPVRLLV